MGGKDLQLLFAMAIGCNSCELPDHNDPPFSKSKAYHSEVKPDAATLKLEVTQQYQAYICKGCQPCPSNWKIDKCLEYLMSNPIPTSEKRDLDFLQSELEEWKGIQRMVNDSHKREDDRILHQSWSCDIPYLRLYHTLVEDHIRCAFRKAYHAMPRLVRNWMAGTLRFSKIFMSWQRNSSMMANGPQIVLCYLIYTKTMRDPNRFPSMLHELQLISSRRSSTISGIRWSK